MDNLFLYGTFTILVFIGIISLWAYIFQHINADIQYRVIKRGDGYAIQKRGQFKWVTMTNDHNEPLIFGDRMIAGMIVAEALKQMRSGNKSD